MLKKIIKSVGRRRWKHDDPEIRAKAVADLDPEDSEAEAILRRLAAEDPELEVRRAAASKLTRGEALVPLIGGDDLALARTAAERFGEISADNESPATSLDTPNLLERVACYATAERVAVAALERIQERKTLAQLAVNAALSRVRHAAVERVMDEAHLAQVEKQTRNRDKTVHRIARHRLDRIRHLRQALAQAHEALERLVSSTEQLATAALEPMYERRLEHLSAQWNATRSAIESDAREAATFGLASGSVDALTIRFDAAAARAGERISVPTAVEPSEADTAESPVPIIPASGSSESSASDAPAPEQALDPETFKTILVALSELRARLGKAFDPETFAKASAALDEEQAAWLTASDRLPPPGEQSEQFHEICHELNDLVQAQPRLSEASSDLDQLLAVAAPELSVPSDAEGYQQLWRLQHDERGHARRLGELLRRVSWPQGFARPELLETTLSRRSELAAFDTHVHEVHERLRDRLSETLDKMEESLDAGSLRSATGLHGEGKHLLRSLPHGSGRGLQRRFTALAEKVREFKDWETYATAPKREALCADMEALAESAQEPETKAPRIKGLREAWRELGPPVSARDRQLLARFNEAAEKAFAPCRAYFEEQSDLRQWNLENRIKICDELEHFCRDNDWSHPDWRAVEQILRTAQIEWRKFTPVDRTRGRDVNNRFRAVLDDLRNRLKEQWNHNIEAKEAIIQEAEQSRDSQPVHEAVETLKDLQRRWQSVGLTPRQKDQILWKSFREVCDQVFSARDQEQRTRREEQEGQSREAQSICEELEQLIDTHAPEEASIERLQEFTRRLNQLELPHESQRRLQTRFDHAAKAYRGLVAHAAQARDRGALVGVMSLEELLAQSEAQMLAGNVPAADSIKTNVENVELTRLPVAIQDALARRLNTLLEAIAANDVQPLSAALEEAFEARRRIVIKLEIFAGIDSPDSEQALRLEQQVNRLARGMGSRVTVEESAEDLIAEWLSAGPDLPERSRELRERFSRALDEARGAAA